MSEFIPNTFQTPNAVVDGLMELLTDSELRVFLYTIRHVLGWQKKIKSKKAAISISNYVNGFSYIDEKGTTHSYSGCGLKEAAVRDALQSLEKFRILKSSSVSVHGREWELAFMTDDNVDFAALINRHYEKNTKGKNKMVNARKANPKLIPPVQQNPSCDTEVDPSCATEPLPSCDTEDNETHVETHSKPNIAPKVVDGKALPKPQELLALALGTTLVSGDFSNYGGVCKKLTASGISPEMYPDYVKFIRGLSQKQGGWDVTVNSLVSNGRMSEYVTKLANAPQVIPVPQETVTDTSLLNILESL